MRCFFYDPATVTGKTLRITGQQSRHIASVLRLTAQTRLTLYDGCGEILTGEIVHVSPEKTTIQILSRATAPQVTTPLILAQALLKGKKMDFLLQKATELGVDVFIPIHTRYCEKKIHALERQKRRWQRIILEACKQCHRPVPMRLEQPVELTQLSIPDDANLIMPWEDETSQPLTTQSISTQSPTLLLIGPEGGFHPAEVDFACNAGFTTVSLGPRILRAETAALAATSIIQYINRNLDPSPR